jgi:Rrf2 family protein
MKLSTKGRYGTRALLDLAVHADKNPVLLKDIAKRQEISVKYLDRLFSSLKTAGLVKSIRGAKGGFILNNQPSQITLKQIMEALEGPLELVECVRNKHFCHRANFCVTRELWDELGSAMQRVLKTTTLEDLVSRDKQKRKIYGAMYYI